jgi:hypothetical protein
MSFGGSSSTQNTSGSSTTSLDPQLDSTAYGNIATLQTMAATPFQPYTGQQVAAFTPAQLQAQDAYTGIANNQIGAAPLQSAINTAQGVAGYAPSMISAPALSSVDLSGYMNPYTSQVIGASLQDLTRQQQIQDQNDASKATAAGAFGGSRSAVLQNLDHDSYARAAASTVAGLNQANYTQAQNAGLGDLTRQLTASQANQSAGLQGAALNLNAAGSLANMGNEQLSQALQRAGALSTVGDAQQQNQQAQLNAAYQQWQLAQQYPLQIQGLLNGAIGALPKTGTTDTTGTGSTDSSQFGFGGSLSGSSSDPSDILKFAIGG